MAVNLSQAVNLRGTQHFLQTSGGISSLLTGKSQPLFWCPGLLYTVCRTCSLRMSQRNVLLNLASKLGMWILNSTIPEFFRTNIITWALTHLTYNPLPQEVQSYLGWGSWRYGQGTVYDLSCHVYKVHDYHSLPGKIKPEKESLKWMLSPFTYFLSLYVPYEVFSFIWKTLTPSQSTNSTASIF